MRLGNSNYLVKALLNCRSRGFRHIIQLWISSLLLIPIILYTCEYSRGLNIIVYHVNGTCRIFGT